MPASQARAETPAAEAVIPAIQLGIGSDGQKIQPPRVEAATWRDPDDIDLNRRAPREVRGFRVVDVIQRVYLDATRSPAGLPVVDEHGLTAARLLAEDYEMAEGARPGMMSGTSSRSSAPIFGPGAVQMDAIARYRAAVQALGLRRSAVLLPVVLTNRTPRTGQLDALRLALAALVRHYDTSAHPRWGGSKIFDPV